MGRYNRINPFGKISKEEIQQSSEQEMGKHAITAKAPMEETDVEVSAPMSAADVKAAWANYREANKVKKESRLRQ